LKKQAEGEKIEGFWKWEVGMRPSTSSDEAKSEIKEVEKVGRSELTIY
jgi:hypothetical protein